MERPTTDIILPQTKARVVAYTYLTTAQSRALQRIALGDTTVSIKGDVSPVKATASIDMQDQALHYMIKAVYEEDKLVEDPIAFIGDLPDADGKFLYDQIDRLTRLSSQSEEDKKK